MYVPCLFCLLFCLRTSKSLSMGEFDKFHLCMGILDDLGSNFGINLHNYAVYARISLITIGLSFVEF